MKSKMHNRKSPRYQVYDYNSPGYYFITTCVQKFECVFGEIKNKTMIKNDLGIIVEKTWLELIDHYENVELDYYVVMPNHFHGIIIINEKLVRGGQQLKTKINTVGEGLRPSPTHEMQSTTITKKYGLTEIVRAFKSFSSRRINEMKKAGERFKWQRSFYDRIVRNEKELYFIRRYIEQNPMKWDIEKNRPDNIEIF